jgi:hypothetical protein
MWVPTSIAPANRRMSLRALRRRELCSMRPFCTSIARRNALTALWSSMTLPSPVTMMRGDGEVGSRQCGGSIELNGR